VQSLARRLEQGEVLSCHRIAAAAQPFLAALLQQLFPSRPIVLVTDSLKAQESFQQDIATWLQVAGRRSPSDPSSQPPDILFFPAWEMFPHEPRLPHVDIISERLETLVALSNNSKPETQNPKLVVTTVTALQQRTFHPEDLRARTRRLARGDRADPRDLVEWLEAQGYEPEAQVTQRGEIALRGGILDVFPLTSPWPVRLEFFGDELESLRRFDPLTQMSRDEIAAVALPPAGELGVLKSSIHYPASSHPNEDTQPSPLNPPVRLATLLDYLPPQTIFILCEPGQLAERAGAYESQVAADDPFLVGWHEFREQLAARRMTVVEVAESGDEPAGIGPDSAADRQAAVRNPQFQSLDAYRPLTERVPEPPVVEAQRHEFFNQLHRWLRQDYAVHVFCNNEGERQRFAEIWTELGLGEAGSEKFEGREVVCPSPLAPRPSTQVGTLARGFLCDEAKLVVVTDAEIFGRYRVQRPRRLKSPHAQAARSALDIDFTELAEGDLVVHVQHGIGRYLGLKSLPLGSTSSNRQPAIGNWQSTECLVIEFAPTDPDQPSPKLYVPVTEAHLVGKYVGAGKARPPLNTLGGMRWARAKEQAERAVRDVAGELLTIQAARESQAGHAFAPDTTWQREFESAFIFEETPDQLRAVQETKSDMERPKPMDRLICGDVGFGKTEVAIRASFKAVMDGRQVAVLVPTTVLAQQHFNTFRERMADYPVRIELLSRFRTRGQQQRVVKDLAAGSVDLVIGTHRLLQDDIAFKELGLVVIDEEQRFGVMHKEKFKMLRQLVDVLTLSATPIPRTLYLALTGARDMSTIQTPPHDRLPVETIAVQYDERVIRDAIQRELNRGGQVFFLHNRVMTIQSMADRLKRLLPRARIVVGHGQMPEHELEEVMTRFVNGDADVLLSTTIIESGLDIPNANTIIIDRADRFGLSDLYQLRGRVGRYKHQAYAYLLLPRHAGLLADVRRRISAVKQYSTLGSGFKIAMRDLEIRGAGNLLGAEQSGHITAVGFELYCQLLKQSVAVLKGEKVKPRVEVQVWLDFLATGEVRIEKEEERTEEQGEAARPTRPSSLVPRPSAALPHPYIPEPRHRIEMYRKLAQATDPASLGALKRELRDRFGPVPPPVELLLQLVELKILAGERGIRVIEVKEDRLMLTRGGDFITLGGKFPRLTKKTAGARLKEIKKLLLAL
jgi:transcription-repair coupling factor (superfamily II helicase)